MTAAATQRSAWLQVALAVLAKELRDALRDRRTLATVVLTSIITGPLMLVVLSSLFGTLEASGESRRLVVAGIEHAPTLRNHLERQTWVIETAPTDHEARQRDGRLTEAVLVVPADFEVALQRGEVPALVLVLDSSNRAAGASGGRVRRAVEGFVRERAMLGLALRGVAPQVTRPVELEEHDLASAGSRAAPFTGMLPFFVIMAVLYGALNAALDTTAGERERASLEPLLATPAPRSAIVVGKWAAVTAVGMLIALLGSLSFVPSQALLRSEALSAMFRYGLREAALFMLLLAPLAAAVAALMMAVAIRSRSVKEAQATNTIVLLAFTLLPLVSMFNQGSEHAWQLWVPGLAQSTLMQRVLKGESLADASVWLSSSLACGLIVALCLFAVTRALRQAALK